MLHPGHPSPSFRWSCNASAGIRTAPERLASCKPTEVRPTPLAAGEFPHVHRHEQDRRPPQPTRWGLGRKAASLGGSLRKISSVVVEIRELGLTTFTLDTNCLIAIDVHRPEETPVRALTDAAAGGNASVAVVAISASEKQQGGGAIQNFGEFRERLSRLGLGHLEILPRYLTGILRSGTGPSGQTRRVRPLSETFTTYCSANRVFLAGLLPCKWHRSSDHASFGRWRNCKCDVLALWSHIHHNNRDVFVTDDRNFHAETKKPALIALGANRIEIPSSALSLI